MIDRRRLLLLSQTWMLVAAGLMGALTFVGVMSPWLLLLMTFMLGLGSAMNSPAWQAIVPELVSRRDLPAAMTLESVAFNVLRAVGPAIGGFLVAAAGSGAVFLLNAVSFLGVGLDRIPQDKQRAVLTEFPRLAFKNQFQVCLCNVVRRKPATSFDNVLRDFGIRYVAGFTPPSFADLFANAPFSE